MLCSTAWGAGNGSAPSVSDPVLAAHEAYRSRDLAALEKLATRADGLLLGDYIQFWWIEARLGTALHLVAPAEVRRFLAHADGPLTERLRADWLKALAQQQDWTELLAAAGNYAGSEPDVLCGLATAHQQAGDGELPESLRTLWLSGRGTPASCDAVFARLLSAGRLSTDDLFTRFEAALQSDNLALARTVASWLPAEQVPTDSAFAQAAAEPAAWLERLDSLPAGRGWQMLALQLLTRVARSDPPRARVLWARLGSPLGADARALGWARIGAQAAQALDPEALADFQRARGAHLQEGELEWWVRAALRAGAWDEVLRATDQMGESQAALPAWRYWRARALKALGRRDEALFLFSQVGHPTEFYGQLAAEELGQHVALAGQARGDPEDARQLRDVPGMQRALALFRLGLQPEAMREWSWVLRGADARGWLAAAEVARDAEWYDRMISAAEHAGADADGALRYPLPFRDELHAQARENGLDEAWVYGLVRQESRFLPQARSRSGALGLMQLMPATARWVARRMGWRDFKTGRSQEVQTNLQLGSYYLRHVLDDLGNPVLATAGYNAGPHRVRQWIDGHTLEGAVFCETIPLAETRDYTEKVMANATLYAQRLGLPGRGLKARLGAIKGLAGLPANLPETQAGESGSVADPVPPPAAATGSPPAPTVMPSTPTVIPPLTVPAAPPEAVNPVIDPALELVPVDP